MRKVLIANRGEIAVRVARACDDAGISSVAVYADIDADAMHVALADEAYSLGGNSPADTYLNIGKLLDVAAKSGADAVHPGYGFLSENADFAQAVIDAGLEWVGPSPESIRQLGNKITAREIAVRAGAPLVAGSDGPVASAAEARAFAEAHGLPIAIKAAFGGGGRGLKVVRELAEVEEAFDSAVREAVVAFGRGECFVEQYLDRPRHVEAQIIADKHGNVVVAGTRDCSLQRRHQKLVEEAPAPYLSGEQRHQIYEASKAIVREAGYYGAGTVEFLVSAGGAVAFLEVNTRLQVEHPVTEETAGVDLVQEQFRIASGLPLSITEDPSARSHSFEFRINAEDVGRGFLPSPGTVASLEVPAGPGIRWDSGVRAGSVVAPQFDSLLAKLIVTGADRQQALRRARRALAELKIVGLPTVVPFHRAVLEAEDFVAADALRVHTRWIETDFADRIPNDPDYSVVAFNGERRTITVDVDGKRLAVGLPADLLEGWARSGQGLPPVSGLADTPGSVTGEAPAGSALVAAMSGTVVKWLAEPGDEVAEGDPLVVLEAMKMETQVSAHRAGTLTEVLSAPGGVVATGAVLAHIE
ncbi:MULTISPECIES: biotin carboxylase N-terminal domain-containing protein [Paenarthrobacter]|uniref:acetyl/propionyl/methylcrotonyl-CoA carboxylase subunit alpha n=1 Tax=Paenarthrobacter TaxID=1742992 RepID=UPI00074D2B1A|nr:biotin carboxylase N-terminal domain-containing protein [Paenarthrobacter ureafaciens]AMB38835.1 acetyl-/propionyl-CoA carboxylase subunit alpha [Arthrobacter sp. ATCC 21022]BCW82375.1 acetyl-/propionyl-CoA carboxylase subunit alpha [Arthrobacter sp. NicSoilE8]KUR63277.1 acetyl-COA carboxylase [Arthrobacter sp. ATCC 21022]MBN9128239.1 ATP-grasp domain-containing protein [Paenarthrobacter ureafaciens]RWW95029.1 ATP-grasp domain-containing protein [Paenarthrobacter ureafaciens]